MPTWSGTRKKLEEDYLCSALRGRVRYFATTYSKCPDHEGRAAILVDGVEVLESSYYEQASAFWRLQSLLRQKEEADWREAAQRASQTVLDDGRFDQRDFYAAFQEFDNQSIEASLASEHPIVRIFALLDRRLGKRRLAALADTMEKELNWVYPFYRLRMEAEGLYVTFESVKKAVREFVDEMEKQYTKELNVERVKDLPEIYMTFIDLKDCDIQIIVNEPDWAPYRYVDFQVVAMLDERVEPVFIWHDSDEDDIDSIIKNLRSGIEYAINYTPSKG